MSVDFGTSSSAAAVIIRRKPELVTPIMIDAVGAKIFPTVAYVDNQREIHTCHQADLLKGNDLSRYLREFKLDLNWETLPVVNVSYVEVVSKILETLRNSAIQTLNGDVVDSIIITIPAIYDSTDIRIGIMRAAATDAGFKKVEIIKEAEAAAIYYDYLESNSNGISLVYDLGGGTFDPALIKHNTGQYELLGKGRGVPVGGKFFTERITKHYIKTNQLNDAQRKGVSFKCEDIKRYLTYNEKWDFPVEEEGRENYVLTRHDFEDMIGNTLDRTIESCSQLIGSVNLEWKDISRILMVGGSCYIPLVIKKIQRKLDSVQASQVRIVKRETESGKQFDPQFAVALGGSIYAMNRFMAPPPRPQLGYIEYIELERPKIYHLHEGDNVLGREAKGYTVDIPLSTDDMKMSRKHFIIKVQFIPEKNEYEYTAQDISTNGTYVNKTRIKGCQRLHNEDIITASSSNVVIRFMN
ncbi:MAG: Hsp70 family protein [Dysgonomonas sp.]